MFSCRQLILCFPHIVVVETSQLTVRKQRKTITQHHHLLALNEKHKYKHNWTLTKRWIIMAKCCLRFPECWWWPPGSSIIRLHRNKLPHQRHTGPNGELHEQLNDTRSRIQRAGELSLHFTFYFHFIWAIYCQWITPAGRRRPPRWPWPWRRRPTSPCPRSPRCPARPPCSCPAGPDRNRRTRATALRSAWNIWEMFSLIYLSLPTLPL